MLRPTAQRFSQSLAGWRCAIVFVWFAGESVRHPAPKQWAGATPAPCCPRKVYLNTLFASRCIRSHVGAFLALACSLVLLNWLPRSWAAENRGFPAFEQEIEPILIDYCYRCHANGTKKGGVAFDEFVSDESLLAKRELWSAVLKNVRAGIMPPAQSRVPRTKKSGS